MARAGLAAGRIVAMPVEKSGLDYFDFEYGDDFGAHIESFDPTFSKILVRYNPEGNADDNTKSLAGLRTLSEWLHARDRKFLLELLVPGEPHQIEAAGGEDAYDTNVRPGLMREAIAAMQGAGIEAVVQTVQFLGADTRLHCTLVDGTNLVASGVSARLGGITAGSKVRLSWNSEAAFAVSDR